MSSAKAAGGDDSWYFGCIKLVKQGPKKTSLRERPPQFNGFPRYHFQPLQSIQSSASFLRNIKSRSRCQVGEALVSPTILCARLCFMVIIVCSTIS